MATAAAEGLVKAIRGQGVRPLALLTCAGHLAQAIAPLAEALKIRIRQADQLPRIEQARESLKAFLRRP
jgi:hypothetical protein